ncbi:M3 family metallopeptidase [Ideonella azotifigens]|uniref:oligopeptidase A n=1 Tax=Ideonella azotifigens TaxID=513160 RepID=A0ABN1JSE7_9BURK|nr:M3 family metallopeptidase [Ideonella azotifigens]MCD2340903.1 M3 family metallopeptidase [Ideonella azotifigens]
MTNPLLQFDTLTDFQAIRPEHVTPAMDQLLADASTALERAVSADVPADYDALSATLGVATERLGRAWGAVGHLNQVADSPELRAAHAENLPKVTEFFTRQGSDERLYAKYKAVASSPAAEQLNPARRQALNHWLRDFKLGGADLQGDAKTRFAAIQDRMAELSQAFSNHVLDATDAFAYYASAEELAGVPEDAVAAARSAAEAEGKDGHKITLHFPSYFPVMQYGSNRALRETLYRAYATRASEFGPADRDNSAVMSELLTLRAEEAALLGYANYAEVSLASKMARSPAEVMSFLRDLAQRARPSAEQDLSDLRAFAKAELGLADLQAWDVAYASEKLKEARYAFSDQEVKAYLPLPKVLQGLFGIIETLFEVAIRPADAPVWHESVRFYRIERGSELVGEFYLDPHARPGKRPGAWMDNARDRWKRADTGSLQTPVAFLVCNFAAPVGDKPALLNHDDVITLFHEFGHGLHHLLTRVEDLGVSGIGGVEWDAVELPSQFMENFCWEWEVIKHLSAHVDSGEPLPRALYDKMLAAKNFQSGLQTLRQVEFGLYDMRLHTEADAAQRVLPIVQEVRAEVAVMQAPEFSRTPNTFSHIFAGGYSAGYYSYKWAEVLSADAWSAFEEQGVLNADTGRRYRREILEMGGSRPALDSFKAFRGREPSIDALLRHQGMAN